MPAPSRNGSSVEPSSQNTRQNSAKPIPQNCNCFLALTATRISCAGPVQVARPAGAGKAAAPGAAARDVGLTLRAPGRAGSGRRARGPGP